MRKMHRRVCLQMGGLSALGVTLPELLSSRQAVGAVQSSSARACILLYMTGGPAQQETFDMKPNAAEAPRGEFRPISTSVPGIQICELLPLLARNAHRFAVIRSMHHDQTFHGGGSHYNLTGFPLPPRDPTPEFYLDRRDSPGIGACHSTTPRDSGWLASGRSIAVVGWTRIRRAICGTACRLPGAAV